MGEVADAKEPQVDDFRKRIRDAGLRSTGARIGVLRILENASTPMTHGEVSARLAAFGFDHATIYRNLVDMTEAGLLNRTDLGDHSWRFEVKRGEGDHKQKHPHFLCLKCGDVECLPDQAVRVKSTRGTPKALKRRGVIVQLQGRCDACAAAG
jgi:Fur family transcriptional regulator, ferric uptake regulator